MGYWGKNLVRNFHQLGALRVVCDSDPRVRDQVARDYAGAEYCASYEDLLKNPNVSGVALATPAIKHYEMAKAALEAGKDVFVEKPLAVEVKQGEELVKLAAARGRMLMVGHILQYHPAVLKLRELVRSGALGPHPLHLFEPAEHRQDPHRGEHPLELRAARHLGDPGAARARCPSASPAPAARICRPDVADVTVSQLQFPERRAGPHLRELAASRSRSSAWWWWAPRRWRSSTMARPTSWCCIRTRSSGRTACRPRSRPKPKPVALDNGEPLKAECQAFLDCIASRKPAVTDGDEGLRVLKVLDACQRSL